MQHQTPRAIRACANYGRANDTAQAGGNRAISAIATRLRDPVRNVIFGRTGTQIPERVAHEEEGRADVRSAAQFSPPNGRAPQGFSCLIWTPMPRGFCTSRVNFAHVTGFGWAVQRGNSGELSPSAELMVDPESGARCVIRGAGGGRYCA